ncbi:hypothetical protein HYT55_05455 [Candidatus Woesearchaeota archaeon]|nr:hypothetical protein [Candidatus Woesearchaeota archaeon]
MMLIYLVAVVLCSPLLGMLLGKIAVEEIAFAKKFLVSLLWVLGVSAVLLVPALWMSSAFLFLLAVDLFLFGLCSGILFYEHRWGQ